MHCVCKEEWCFTDDVAYMWRRAVDQGQEKLTGVEDGVAAMRDHR